MNQEWDSFPIRTEVGPAEHDSFVRVSESDRDAVLVWAAGPLHVFRTPARLDDFGPSTVERTDKRGVRTVTKEPRTADEQQFADEMNDHYLAEAGISPRPSGFHWYVRVRPGDGLDALHHLLRPTVRILDAREVRAETERLYANYIRK